MNKQIRSRKNVADFGEVFTNSREVKAMLDLLDFESKISYSIKTTFLEPACGNGAFLIEILRRKLSSIKTINITKKNAFIYSLWALSSIYGIDKQNINVKESRMHLLKELKKFYKNNKLNHLFKLNEKFIDKILNLNIICNDSSNWTALHSVVFSKYDWNIDKKEVLINEFYLTSFLCRFKVRALLKPYVIKVFC